MTYYKFIARHRDMQIYREFFFKTLAEARKANPDFVEWEMREVMPNDYDKYDATY